MSSYTAISSPNCSGLIVKDFSQAAAISCAKMGGPWQLFDSGANQF
jgi:hypothetical protein